MKNFKKKFLDYVVGDRKVPRENRERVGQNLMILSVLTLLLLLERIGNLVLIYLKGRPLFIKPFKKFRLNAGLFMIVMEIPSQKIQPLIIFMLLLINLMCRLPVKNYMFSLHNMIK